MLEKKYGTLISAILSYRFSSKLHTVNNLHSSLYNQIRPIFPMSSTHLYSISISINTGIASKIGVLDTNA